MENSEIKKRGPKTDPCPAAWLDHLRAWCAEPGPAKLTRFDLVPWGKYEQLLDVRRNKVNLWLNQVAAGGNRGPVLLTRSDYLRLCPLLAGWHQYEPPTSEWQVL